MKIWVDADACPVVIKEIIFKAATRTKVLATLVANQYIKIPKSPFIKMMLVSSGFDVADDEIVKLVEAGDIVVTSDIPLAAEIIEKGGLAISPRGELHTADNIRSRLNMRDFLDTMRASGEHTGGPPPLNQSDRQAFANHLDRLLAKLKNEIGPVSG
ncbi:MAG: YaiI/YqxD family protein [Kangiellaceae bacterium]|nr:YaiI/YqxD family protein [Kangiellaceae bacterium]